VFAAAKELFIEGDPRKNLKKLFGFLVERNFTETIGWPDFEVTDYISALLVHSAHVDFLYRIQDHKGKNLETVVELLYESEINKDRADKSQDIHRVIGDLTLFMAGLYPEYLNCLKLKNMIHHNDHLVDYIKAGKRSYSIAATIISDNQNSINPATFQKLSSNFELCVTGLGFVRQDLDRMAGSSFQSGNNPQANI